MKKAINKYKVLVGTPHNEVKNYCFDDWAELAKTLTYPNYDLMIVDNSKDRSNCQKILSMGIKCDYVKPKNKSSQQYIAESLELLRMTAIRDNYDILVILEDDVFPPHDFIQRLLSHKEKIVSGMYMIGQGSDSELMLQDIEQSGDCFRHSTRVDNGYGILRADGTLQRVHACGMGCMMIHRDIFSKVKFRAISGVSAPHPDSLFALDLDGLKLAQYLDTSLYCEHRNTSWFNGEKIIAVNG